MRGFQILQFFLGGFRFLDQLRRQRKIVPHEEHQNRDAALNGAVELLFGDGDLLPSGMWP